MRPLIVLELGPHHFDIVRFLFGEPQDVYTRTLKVTPAEYVAGEEVATTLLGYPDRLAQVELSWASLGYPADAVNPDVLAIEGTEGSLFLDYDGQMRLSRRDGRQERIAIDTTDAYRRSWQAALAHFAECLVSGEPFETSGTDNLNTLRLVFAAYDSAATHQAIPISSDRTTIEIERQNQHEPEAATRAEWEPLYPAVALGLFRYQGNSPRVSMAAWSTPCQNSSTACSAAALARVASPS
jgi:hypothetical protein